MLGSMPALVADAVDVSPAPAREAPVMKESAEPSLSWYGWQTLLIDAGCVALTALSLEVNNGQGGAGAVVLLGAGGLGYVFGGPAVHWQHDREFIAYADITMRLGAPLLLGQLAAAAASQPRVGCETFCSAQAQNFGEGLIVGIATAVLVDAIALSWESAPAPKASATQTPRLTWTPIAGATRSGAIGGLEGTF
jgi:hypothetical protein